MTEKKIFISPGMAVEVTDEFEGAEGVNRECVIFLRPDWPEGKVYLAEISVEADGETMLVSAVGSVLPSAIIGLAKKDPVGPEELTPLLIEGYQQGKLIGYDSAVAATQMRLAIREGLTFEVNVES